MADQVNGRFKAFLFVGLAYFLVAVIAPFLLLVLKGANWKYPIGGMSWSLVAGIAGAIGAFGVLLAFGAKGSPAVVMAIVFAGAPVVNALVAISLNPPAGGWGTISSKFWLGIILAAAGGCLVTLNKPNPGHGPAPKPAVAAQSAESAH
jgi:drug/metabolite transporter (DMT)-like permease